MKKIIFISIFCILATSCTSVRKLVDFIDNPVGHIVRDSIESDDPENYDEGEPVIEAILETASNVKNVVENDILPEEAYYIGRTVAAKITENYQLYTEPEVVEYLNKICKTITINSPVPYLYKDYCVAILDSDEINALATPGGHIFVSRGILKCTDSEDALAAVLAHEISHIQLNHSLNAIKSSRVTSAVLTGVKDVSKVARENVKNNFGEKTGIEIDLEEEFNFIMNAGDEIIHTLVDSGFSVAQEFAADKNALFLMSEAGYDPSAMNAILDLLEDNLDENSSGWSKTHPSPKARKNNLKSAYKKNPYKGSGKKNRQKRYKLVKKSF